VRRDGVEVALDNPQQRRAIAALVARHDTIGRRVLRQIVRVVKIGGRPSRLPWTTQPGIVLAGQVPFDFGDLPILDAHADGDDGRAAPLHDRAEECGLPGHGIEVPALHIP
jgi:hypothetical protein